jgi:hypothetical protein
MCELDSDGYKTIYYINLPVCIISAITNLLIFIAYVYFKDLRNYNYRLVFYMSMSELLTCIGNFYLAFMLPWWSSCTICTIQAIILNFSCLSSVLWTSVIAFTIYRSLVLEKTDGWKYEMYYLLYAFGLPLSLNFLPMLTDSFGKAEGWCWIDIEDQNFIEGFLGGNIWRVINYLGPLWIVIISNFILHCKNIAHIKKMTDHIDDDFNKNFIVKRLKLYPMMLLICHLPVTFHRTLGFFDIVTGETVWISALISSFFLIFSGFLNAMVYGLTDRVKKELQKMINRESSSSSLTSSEDEARASLL